MQDACKQPGRCMVGRACRQPQGAPGLERPVQAGQTREAAELHSLLRTAMLEADLWLHLLQSPCQRWWWRAAAAPRRCLPVWPACRHSCMEGENQNDKRYAVRSDSDKAQLDVQLYQQLQVQPATRPGGTLLCSLTCRATAAASAAWRSPKVPVKPACMPDLDSLKRRDDVTSRVAIVVAKQHL